MDGLFGLPRKKSAGCSHRESLHGHLWFSDQSEVDEFVAQSQHTKGRNDVRNYFVIAMLFIAINWFRIAAILWLAML